MPSKAAVVIPNHKEELNELEKISLAQCRKVLGHYPIIFALPIGKHFSFLRQDDKIIYFPPQYFQNVKAYNVLMMSPFFYEMFKDFEYILIYELDAFVFRDELEYFCSLGYDYIGAPWPYYAKRNFPDIKNVRVGNSGFCLRKVKVHYKFLLENADFFNKVMYMPNDDFFAYCGARKDINFSVPPVDIAARFSVEYLLEHSLKSIGGKFPFGCHGWTKMSADFYVKVLAQFGYDLRPLKNKMDNIDYNILRNGLTGFAFQRLSRRLQRGQSILRYLPTKRFASVRVIRHPITMMILARLLFEDSSLADNVFLYDPDEQDLLLQDLTLQKLPHLLIDVGGGVELVSAIEQKGFSYGKRIISFQREYMQFQERLFHKLGR